MITAGNWSMNDSVIQSGLNQIYGLCPGTYTVEIYVNGVVVVETFTIGSGNDDCSTFQVYTQQVNPSSPSANDGEIYASVSGNTSGLSFLWSTGETTSSIAGLSSGTYNVCAFNDLGCESCWTVTLISDSTNNLCDGFELLLVDTMNASNPMSCDGAVWLTVNNGTAPYTYYSNNSSSNTGEMTNLCSGWQYAYVYDANGCSAYIEFEIGAEDTTSACDSISLTLMNTGNTSNMNSCDGWAYVQANSGVTPYTYYSSNNQTSANGELTNLCYGWQYAYVVDAAGCYTYVEFMINSNDTVTNPCDGFAATSTSTNTSSLNSCDGTAQVTVFGGVAPYTFYSNNGVSSPNGYFDNLCEGWNWITIVDANNCSISSEFYIYSNDTTSNPCNNFWVNVETTNTTGINECDGTVNFLPSGGTAPYYTLVNGQATALENLNNVCSGVYYTEILDYNGCSFLTQYYVGYNMDTTQFPLYVYAYPSAVTSDGACDGTVYIDVYGGTAPYVITNDNGDITDNYVSGLCEGVYSAFVTDYYGQTSMVTYFIASPDDIYNNGGYEDSTAIDTLYSGVVEDCLIDYFTLDTAYISSFELIGNDSLVVTWSVITANGTTEIIESYNISGWGVYELILQVFCPQRSGSPYFIVKQRLMIGFSGVNENTALQFNVYPNPVVEELHITLEEKAETSVQLTDMNGRILFETKENTTSFVIPFNKYSNGNYIVKVENKFGTNYKKLIK